MPSFHIVMGRLSGRLMEGAYRVHQLGGKQCVGRDFSVVAWWHY